MSEEASYAHLSRPASIDSLPYELLTLISSDLDTPSLTRFSRTTKANRSASVPCLFKEVYIVEDRTSGAQDCIEALSRNSELCRLIKHISLKTLPWGWHEQSSFDDLARLLSQADLRSLTISWAKHHGYHASEFDGDSPFVAVWKTISQLPKLESLHLESPLDFDLHFRDFPALQRLRLSNGDLRESVGNLPDLTQLSLDKFRRIDSSWLPPRIVRSLRVLRLSGIGDFDLLAVTLSNTQFLSSLTAPSSLVSITLDITQDPPYTTPSGPGTRSAIRFDRLATFIGSYHPQVFPYVRALEIRCIRDHLFNWRTQSAINFLSLLVSRFPRLQELTIMSYRLFEERRIVDEDLGSNWLRCLQVLSRLTELKFLSIDCRDVSGMDVTFVEETFDTFRKLLYFGIRTDSLCPATREQDEKGWIFDRDDRSSFNDGPVEVGVKPFLQEAFDKDSTQLGEDHSMEWYREMITKVRAIYEGA